MIDTKYGAMIALGLISCDAFSVEINKKLDELNRRLSDDDRYFSKSLYETTRVSSIAEVADVIKRDAAKIEKFTAYAASKSKEIGEILETRKKEIEAIDTTFRELDDRAALMDETVDAKYDQLDELYARLDKNQKKD